MRKRIPKPGAMRIVSRFLWFPTELLVAGTEGEEYESRWLERATIKQVWQRRGIEGPYSWRDYAFVEESRCSHA